MDLGILLPNLLPGHESYVGMGPVDRDEHDLPGYFAPTGRQSQAAEAAKAEEEAAKAEAEAAAAAAEAEQAAQAAAATALAEVGGVLGARGGGWDMSRDHVGQSCMNAGVRFVFGFWPRGSTRGLLLDPAGA